MVISYVCLYCCHHFIMANYLSPVLFKTGSYSCYRTLLSSWPLFNPLVSVSKCYSYWDRLVRFYLDPHSLHRPWHSYPPISLLMAVLSVISSSLRFKCPSDNLISPVHSKSLFPVLQYIHHYTFISCLAECHQLLSCRVTTRGRLYYLNPWCFKDTGQVPHDVPDTGQCLYNLIHRHRKDWLPL